MCEIMAICFFTFLAQNSSVTKPCSFGGFRVMTTHDQFSVLIINVSMCHKHIMLSRTCPPRIWSLGGMACMLFNCALVCASIKCAGLSSRLLIQKNIEPNTVYPSPHHFLQICYFHLQSDKCPSDPGGSFFHIYNAQQCAFFKIPISNFNSSSHNSTHKVMASNMWPFYLQIHAAVYV